MVASERAQDRGRVPSDHLVAVVAEEEVDVELSLVEEVEEEVVEAERRKRRAKKTWMPRWTPT